MSEMFFVERDGGRIVALYACQQDGLTDPEPLPEEHPDIQEFLSTRPFEPTRLGKGDLWRRLSEDEANALESALAAHPSARLRQIFGAVDYLDTNDVDYPILRAGIVAVLGEDRANEVLAPTY